MKSQFRLGFMVLTIIAAGVLVESTFAEPQRKLATKEGVIKEVTTDFVTLENKGKRFQVKRSQYPVYLTTEKGVKVQFVDPEAVAKK